MLVIFCCLSNKDGKKGREREREERAKMSTLVSSYFSLLFGREIISKKLLLFLFAFPLKPLLFRFFHFCVCLLQIQRRKKERRT
jgi:hypothetical protein